MGFEVNVQEFIGNLDRLNNRMLSATRLYAETSAQQMEAYAKQNASWKDITGISI